MRVVMCNMTPSRQVLRVLEALHLKFAYAIDAWLGQLEHYITYPFQLVLSKLNEVISATCDTVGSSKKARRP